MTDNIENRYDFVILFDVKDGKDLYGKSRLPPSPDRKMLRSMIPERLTRSLVEALMSQERTD